jgi:hypothetical protein
MACLTATALYKPAGIGPARQAGFSGYQFRDIRKRAINEAKERGDATAFAGHKDPRTTHRNYFTEAAKPLR